MAGFGTIKFVAYLVGDERAYDWCVVREDGETVVLDFGEQYFEGNAGDIRKWCEEEGLPCIRKEFDVNLVNPCAEIEVGYHEMIQCEGRR